MKFLSYIQERDKSVGMLLDSSFAERHKHGIIELKRRVEEKFGSLRKAIIFLHKKMQKEEIQTFSNEGFTPFMTPKAQEIYIVLELMEMLKDEDIETVVVGTKDTSAHFLFPKLREKKTLVILCDSTEKVAAFSGVSDYLVSLEGNRELYEIHKTNEHDMTPIE